MFFGSRGAAGAVLWSAKQTSMHGRQAMYVKRPGKKKRLLEQKVATVGRRGRAL